MTKFHSYAGHEELTVESKLPEKVESIGVSYDGGRLHITVNGEAFYDNMCAGLDFSVDIE